MEDRAGQAASWLHWDLLSHESSFRTQGIHVNQVINYTSHQICWSIGNQIYLQDRKQLPDFISSKNEYSLLGNPRMWGL